MPATRAHGTYTWYASEKQKRAIAFCESWVHTKFTGNINDYTDVTDYLDKHLAKAVKCCNYVRQIKKS